MEEMQGENCSLREKLANLEQEKINLQGDKERRERDCRNLQVEINRMNSMLQSYKNTMGDMKSGHSEGGFHHDEGHENTQIAWGLSKQWPSQSHTGDRGVLSESALNHSQWQQNNKPSFSP